MINIDVTEELKENLINDLILNKCLNHEYPNIRDNEYETSLNSSKIYKNKNKEYDDIVTNFEDEYWYKNKTHDVEFIRSTACFLGLMLADVFGSITEFELFDTERKAFINMDWDSNKQYVELRKENGRVSGMCSDDTSMARCIADSLLVNKFTLEPIDLEIRFVLWWYFGYNNGTNNYCSIGLGGNISESIYEFIKYNGNKPYTIDINKKDYGNDAGNGSIMRLAPVPIAFHNDEKHAMDIAELTSYTTHNSNEAAECCRLLCFIIVRCINNVEEETDIQIFLNEILPEFKTNCLSVYFLVNSEIEMYEMIEETHIIKEEWCYDKYDRNWNWEDINIQISKARTNNSTTYYGSYVMDAMYIALNILYHSKSAKEVFIKCVNYGGDCDSFGAVALQMAGAFYGMEDWMMTLYNSESTIDDNYTPIAHHDNYNIFYLSYELFNQIF